MKFTKTIILLLTLLVIPCHSYAKDLSADEIKSFRNDFLQINKNRFFNLDELQEKAQTSLPHKVLLWHQLCNSRSKKSFIDIIEFMEENPNFPKMYLLQEQAENRLGDNIDKDVLQKWITKINPETIKGVKYYIDFLPEEEKKSYLTNKWLELDLSSSQNRQFYNTFKKYLKTEDIINKINTSLWQGKMTAVKELVKIVPKDYQNLFNARIALRRNYGSVSKLVDNVPEKLKNDEGLIFDRIKWRRRRGMYSGAIELLDLDQTHKTHHKEWWQERVIIVRHLLKNGQYQQAYDVSTKGDNTSAPILAENQWLSGWIAYRFLNRPDIALGHFLTMRDEVTSFISKARGDYWIARCYEEVMDLQRAWSYYNDAAEYTTTFYGQKAIEKANIKVNDVFKNMPDISDNEYEEYKNSELLQGIKLLSDLKLDKLMNTFALRAFFEAEKDDEIYVVGLVKFMYEINHKEMAVLLSRRARTAGIDVGEYGYPMLDDIKYPKNADIALVHAVVRQESGFNAKAKSPAGARGLMQIMPSTARNLSQWKRLRYSLKRLTSDINYNITLGEYYLTRLLRQHKGSYIQSFAAYNAGAGNVRKWNRDFAKHTKKLKLDEIDWIETISFDETRNYVQRVEENYYIYKELINRKKNQEKN